MGFKRYIAILLLFAVGFWVLPGKQLEKSMFKKQFEKEQCEKGYDQSDVQDDTVLFLHKHADQIISKATVVLSIDYLNENSEIPIHPHEEIHSPPPDLHGFV